MLQILFERLEFILTIRILHLLCYQLIFTSKCDDFSWELDCKTANRLDHTPMVLIFAQ